MQDTDGHSFEEGRAHAPNGYSICPVRMRIMTNHDIS